MGFLSDLLPRSIVNLSLIFPGIAGDLTSLAERLRRTVSRGTDCFPIVISLTKYRFILIATGLAEYTIPLLYIKLVMVFQYILMHRGVLRSETNYDLIQIRKINIVISLYIILVILLGKGRWTYNRISYYYILWYNR